MYKSLVVYLELSAKKNANLKHRVSTGAYHCSGPRHLADSAQVRMATIALHTEHEKTRMFACPGHISDFVEEEDMISGTLTLYLIYEGDVLGRFRDIDITVGYRK